jgi:hypothetical protein
MEEAFLKEIIHLLKEFNLLKQCLVIFGKEVNLLPHGSVIGEGSVLFKARGIHVDVEVVVVGEGDLENCCEDKRMRGC